MRNIVLPELGEGIKEAMVAFWHFKEGDRVQEGDDVVELVTDKASFNISADCNGFLKSILVAEGQQVKIGEVLGVIEARG